MEFKNISLVAVVLTSVFLINSSAEGSKPHQFGNRVPGDKLIAHYTLREDWKLNPDRLRRTTVAPSGHVISMVDVLDLWDNRPAIELVDGKIGQRTITMFYRSEVLRGLYVKVDVYAVEEPRV